MDAATLKFLHVLAQGVRAGDQPGQLRAIEAIGLDRLIELKTIVCAVGVGGVGFAEFIADLATDCAPEPERYRRILDVCRSGREGRTDEDAILEIVEAFGVEGTPAEFLGQLQQELNSVGENPADSIKRALAEMQQGKWQPALMGFLRARASLGDKTPRPVFAHAAMCLHKLGRYAEAEEINLEGLGKERDLIAARSSPLPEREIVRKWNRSQPPMVSILCMTYNHERYIEGAIRGFLIQQTNFPFEILIHDDASTDRTPELVRTWQEKYPTIIRTVLQTENQLSRGVRAFDLLLKLARGRYVATCEGDDYWIEPAKLQTQVGYLDAHPDFSCSGHNYYLLNESRVSVTRWDASNTDQVVSPRQLMNVSRLLWLPTLVFRKTFSTLPPERDMASLGDQFLTSYLGTFGKCAYFESLLGAVRRENQYSIWTPLSAQKKELARVRTWAALVALHERLGQRTAAADLRKRIDASPLDAAQKSTLLAAAAEFQAAPASVSVA